MFFSVDRFEGDMAELIGEDGKPLAVPADSLPPGTREGDMLYYGREGFTLAPDKTAERRARVADMLERLLSLPEDEKKDE